MEDELAFTAWNQTRRERFLAFARNDKSSHLDAIQRTDEFYFEATRWVTSSRAGALVVK